MRPCFVEPDVVPVLERVTLAGGSHVVVAIEAHLGGAPVLRAMIAATQAKSDIWRFLAAEAAAHPPALDDDVVRGDARALRDHVLDFARVLRRREDLHAAVLARDGERDLAFEIEVVLSARRDRTLQAARRARQRGRGVAARHVHRRQHIRLGLQRGIDGEQRGQLDEVELCEARRAPGGVRGGGRDGEHRLSRELDGVGREDRIVVHDRTDVVTPMSRAVMTATTSGAACTAARSTPRSEAWATGLTPTATCSVSRGSGKSSV